MTQWYTTAKLSSEEIDAANVRAARAYARTYAGGWYDGMKADEAEETANAAAMSAMAATGLRKEERS